MSWRHFSTALTAADAAALAAPPLGWVPAGILLLLALAGRD